MLGGLNSLQAQATWQYALQEGGTQTPFSNPSIDDQVIKIIPAIEDDGSYIVVSKIMYSPFATYQSYFGDTIIMKQPLVIQNGNSTIVIAKHDCDGKVLITRQIEDIPFYNHLSSEGFQDIVKINNKYYLFANTTNISNDSSIVIDSLMYGQRGVMFIVLNEDLKIDTMRSNSMNTTSYFVNTGPNTSGVVVGPENNIYFICAVRDSAKFLSDDPAVFYKGLSLVKLDTLGNILDVHQLTDTFSMFGGGFICKINSFTVLENGNILLPIGIAQVPLIINNILVTPGANEGITIVFLLDSNFNTLNYFITSSEGSGGVGLGQGVFEIDDYIYILGNATMQSPFILNHGAIIQGDTLPISNFNNSSAPIVLKLHKETLSKEWLIYPNVESFSHFNSSKVYNNKIFSLKKTTGIFQWQNINHIDTIGITRELILEIDTMGIVNETLSFFYNSGINNMDIYKIDADDFIKINDNFIVGGHFANDASFGDTTLYHQSSKTDIFIAKFGTSQCIFCDTAIAGFSVDIDSFGMALNNTAIYTKTYTWLLDDSIAIDTNVNSYMFTDTGTHTICQIVSNNCSADTLCKTFSIQCSHAEALITAEQNNMQVNLSNNSTNTTNYSINWGDGTENQTLQHSYQTAGQYQICLTASNICSQDSACIMVDVATGINIVYANKYTVNMYPNPAKESINIAWNNIEKADKKIILYNLYGEAIKIIKPNKRSKTQKIALKNVTKGIYFVVMEVEGMLVWSEKLMVK